MSPVKKYHFQNYWNLACSDTISCKSYTDYHECLDVSVCIRCRCLIVITPWGACLQCWCMYAQLV